MSIRYIPLRTLRITLKRSEIIGNEGNEDGNNEVTGYENREENGITIEAVTALAQPSEINGNEGNDDGNSDLPGQENSEEVTVPNFDVLPPPSEDPELVVPHSAAEFTVALATQLLKAARLNEKAKKKNKRNGIKTKGS